MPASNVGGGRPNYGAAAFGAVSALLFLLLVFIIVPDDADEGNSGPRNEPGPGRRNAVRMPPLREAEPGAGSHHSAGVVGPLDSLREEVARLQADLRECRGSKVAPQKEEEEGVFPPTSAPPTHRPLAPVAPTNLKPDDEPPRPKPDHGDLIDSHIPDKGADGFKAAVHHGVPGSVRRRQMKATTVIPVVVFAYNRAGQIRDTLQALVKVMPSSSFDLYISQDGSDRDVAIEIEKFMRIHNGKDMRQVRHIVHERDDSGAKPNEIAQGWQPYYAIAHHYRSTINKVFGQSPGYEQIVLLEDDLSVSEDFFELMLATAPLFDQDPTLYCVSGFNDNGKPEHVNDAAALYRSDFFPGLGWMTSRAVWKELNPIWPQGFWDDWMRQPDKRRGRSCIRPEVPRSITRCTADGGASNGEFCAEHLQRMQLATVPVKWQTKDLSYLAEPVYGEKMTALIEQAKPVRTVFEVATLPKEVKEAKLVYRSNEELVGLEQQLDIMSDFKDGIPRTAYRGIVSIRYKGRRLHLVPAKPLYDQR